MDKLLKNYRELISRIDQHIEQLARVHGDNIFCKKGCDDCCRHLALFPVEAFNLARAFGALDDLSREKIEKQARENSGICPFLQDHICMVYSDRPVICRTHGYPLYMEKDGEGMVDFCPKNFKGATEFSRSDMLDLDRLNTLLFAVNNHFVACFEEDFPDRIWMKQALTLSLA